jgi:predicted MFS family arabinose efflux permease
MAAIALAVTAQPARPSLPAIFGIVIFAAVLDVLDQPTRTAVIPRLVPRAQVAAAYDIEQAAQQLGTVIGPLVAGLLLTEVGAGHAFLFGAAASAATVACLLPMTDLPPLSFAGVRKSGLAAAREGIAYLRRRPILESLYLIDLDSTLIGGPYVLFPALSSRVFHTGGFGLGLMYAATGVGALIASIGGGKAAGLQRQGRALIAAGAISGAAIAMFGLVTRAFWLALLLLCVVGAADMFNSVYRAPILELSVPDHLRGRPSADDFIVFDAGERLGDLKTSVIARLIGMQPAIILGGVAQLLLAVAIARSTPSLLQYEASTSGQQP